MLAEPRLTKKELPEGVRLLRRVALGPPVWRHSRALHGGACWPDQQTEAWRFPSLSFIYAGEADLTVGDAILQCAHGITILTPPGVPRASGLGAHWHRAQPERASSDIFWLHLRPFGAEFHVCHTRGTSHESGWRDKRYTVADGRLFPLVEQLLEEMRSTRPLRETVAASCLLTLLCLLQRHWDEASVDTSRAGLSRNPVGKTGDDPTLALQRAQAFVEANLREPLTLQLIAHAAYVSRSRLAQIFRGELKQTVWEYVTARRLEEAKTMLAETDLLIEDVARLSGFGRPSHFFTRFAHLVGVSPGEYRRQAKRHAVRKRR